MALKAQSFQEGKGRIKKAVVFEYEQDISPDTKREKVLPKKPLMKNRPLPIQKKSIPKLAVKRLCECLKLIDDHIINDT